MLIQRIKNFLGAFQKKAPEAPSRTWEDAWKLEPHHLRTPYKLGFNGRHINGTTQQQRELRDLFPAERWQEAYNAGRKARNAT